MRKIQGGTGYIHRWERISGKVREKVAEMELRIEKAGAADIDEVGRLYDGLNEYLEEHVNYPGWRKGIYPVRETAEDGISEGCLYVARYGKEIAGSIILSHEPESAYEEADWQVDLEYRDIFVIHTFAVHPLWLGKGVGKRLMEFTLEQGLEEKIKAVRLDVYEKNEPAIALYRRYGFRYIDTVDLGYSVYGLDRFALYQKLL